MKEEIEKLAILVCADSGPAIRQVHVMQVEHALEKFAEALEKRILDKTRQFLTKDTTGQNG